MLCLQLPHLNHRTTYRISVNIFLSPWLTISNFFLLEHGCFTMLYYFLLHNKVNPPYIYIHSLCSGFPKMATNYQLLFSTRNENSSLSLESELSSVQSLSCVQLFAIPWTTARQASLSITNSWSLLKLMSIELVMPSNPLILCRPLLLLPSILTSIRVLSNESTLRIRWRKYLSLSFKISPPNEHSGLTSFRMDWLDLLAV